MAEVSKGGKKNRKLGRQAHHPAHVHYNQSSTRLLNKAKRVFASSGIDAFTDYCSANGLIISTIGNTWKEVHIKKLARVETQK